MFLRRRRKRMKIKFISKGKNFLLKSIHGKKIKLNNENKCHYLFIYACKQYFIYTNKLRVFEL